MILFIKKGDFFMFQILLMMFFLSYSKEIFVDNLVGPENLAFDKDSLYISDYKGLYKADSQGNLTTVFKGTVDGIAIDKKKNIVYFTGLHEIYKLENGKITTISEGYRLANGLSLCPGNRLIVTDSGIVDLFASNIYEIDLKTGKKKIIVDDVLGANGSFCDWDKNIFYFAETFTGKLFALFPNSKKPVLITKIHENDGVTIVDDFTMGKDGYIYLCNFRRGKIIKINPMTGDKEVVVNGLFSPSSVIFSDNKKFGDGCMYVAQKGPPPFLGKKILKICNFK